jgi:mannose-6-phosphate isomerase-like protein (cupin superfamily)
MNTQPINFQQKLEKLNGHWSPGIIARMNDYHFKLVKVQGEFIWHEHPETDEVFIVLKGRLEIHFREASVLLNEGEMFVVPKHVEHKPVAREECHILLVEPAGTINTGNVVDEKTAPNDIWI